MKRTGAILVLCAALIGNGCSKTASDSVVYVTVTAPVGLPPVTQLRVNLAYAGRTDTELFPSTNSTKAISFVPAATFVLDLPHSSSGNIDIAIDALSAAGSLVSHGENAARIVPGGRTDITVILGPGNDGDGGVLDSGTSDIGPQDASISDSRLPDTSPRDIGGTGGTTPPIGTGGILSGIGGTTGAGGAPGADVPPQSDSGDAYNPNGKRDGAGSDALYVPCDPFTGMGCSSNQKCTALRNGSALALGCGSKGSKAEGETCTPVMPGTLQTGDDCADRLACFSVGSETGSTCRRICPIGGTVNACTGTETCSIKVGTLADSTGLAFCQATTSCLPLEQTGCPTNQWCYYADKVGAICAPAGSKNPGDTCSNANDCVKGSTCLTLGSTGTCFSFCSTAGSGTCPSGTTCSALGGTSDEANLGTCRNGGTIGMGGALGSGGVGTGGTTSKGGTTGSTGGITGTGGSGAGGTTGAGTCISQVVSNGYSCGSALACSACKDTLGNSREAGCKKAIDCLAAAGASCNSSCKQNCLNQAGDTPAMACVTALQTAACSGSGC